MKITSKSFRLLVLKFHVHSLQIPSCHSKKESQLKTLIIPKYNLYRVYLLLLIHGSKAFDNDTKTLENVRQA